MSVDFLHIFSFLPLFTHSGRYCFLFPFSSCAFITSSLSLDSSKVWLWLLLLLVNLNKILLLLLWTFISRSLRRSEHYIQHLEQKTKWSASATCKTMGWWYEPCFCICLTFRLFSSLKAKVSYVVLPDISISLWNLLCSI